MKRKVSTLMVASAALAVGLALMPITGAAKKPSGDVTVNCDAGQSIQAALDKAQSFAEPLVVNVFGTCHENVWIRRDNVTIDGDGAATIIGTQFDRATINVGKVDRILISGLTITGPYVGLEANGGNVTVRAATISNNPRNGLRLIDNSHLAITDGTVITSNGTSGSPYVSAAVFVQNSSFEAEDSYIIENNEDGILADVGANVTLYRTEIKDNEFAGIALALHSIADLRDGSEVEGNSPGAYLKQDSALRIATYDVEFPDAIVCFDDESSFANDGGAVTGDVSCTGFDQVAPAAE